MSILASANTDLWEFLTKGGVFMFFIIASCFVAILVSIHRFLSLRTSSVIPQFLRKELDRCEQYFSQTKSSALFHALKKSKTAIGNIGEVALSSDYNTREEAREAVEAKAKEEMVKLQSGMGILEVVITISPLLGLLGTVSGLVRVFGALGTKDTVASDTSQIAAGIATALNTTIAGLVVAVITVILHSYFTRRIENLAADLEVLVGNVLHQFYKFGGPVLYTKEVAEKKNEVKTGAVKSAIPANRKPS